MIVEQEFKMADLQAELFERSMYVTKEKLRSGGRRLECKIIRDNVSYTVEVELFHQLRNDKGVPVDELPVHFAHVNCWKGSVHDGSWQFTFDALVKRKEFLKKVEELVK